MTNRMNKGQITRAAKALTAGKGKLTPNVQQRLYRDTKNMEEIDPIAPCLPHIPQIDRTKERIKSTIILVQIK